MQRALLAITLLALAPVLAGCADDAATPTPSSPTATSDPTPTATTPTGTTGTAYETEFEEAADANGLPAGWTIVSGAWRVETNESAPEGEHVLRQSATDVGEPAILATEAGVFDDLEANVRINVLAGEKGQAGGIIFRYEDGQNHYVARYNNAEGAWNLFRTIDGARKKFDGVEGVASTPGLNEWWDLHLEVEGGHIVVRSGGAIVIDYTETDPAAPKAGQVGLWVRYDSQTQFDGFEVEAR